MKNTRLLFGLAVLSILSACKTPIQDVSITDPTIEAEIKNRYKTYITAMQALDVETTTDMYLDSDQVIYSRDGVITKGKDILLKNFGDGFQEMEKVSKIHIYNHEVAALSSTAASQTLAYHYMMLTKAQDTIRVKGTATYVFRKVEEDWKCIQASIAHQPFDPASKEYRELQFD